jgi:hypothetical protein
MTEEQTALLICIDEFISDIAKQSMIDTSSVIDRLLDIRNLAEDIAVPV